VTGSLVLDSVFGMFWNWDNKCRGTIWTNSEWALQVGRVTGSLVLDSVFGMFWNWDNKCRGTIWTNPGLAQKIDRMTGLQNYLRLDLWV